MKNKKKINNRRRGKAQGKNWATIAPRFTYVNFFLSVLPLLESFILISEQKEPQIHLLHRMLVENFWTILVFFMKVFNDTSLDKFCRFCSNDKNFLYWR